MDRIPLAIPNVGEREGEYLQECVKTNFVSTVGQFVDRFEHEIADLHGAAGGVAVAAGTMGLHAALVVLGVRPGDLVIAPSFTFIASANAIVHAGASPWLIDINASSWTMSPEALASALDSQTERSGDDLIHKPSGRRVAAIMPVYTLGAVADMDAIGAVAERYGLPSLADAAAAVGVEYMDRPIGPAADLTVFSFNGNKTITTGGGGMIIGPDQSLLATAKHLTTTARASRDYDHDAVGWNYRMTNLEAALGCAQLERLDDFLTAKRAIRQTYDDAFDARPETTAFPSPPWTNSACWFSGFLLNEGSITAKQVCAALSEDNIEARPFWKPVHLQEPYRDAPTEDLTVTERVWDRIVTLPCSTSLTSDEQTFVIERVMAVLDAAA